MNVPEVSEEYWENLEWVKENYGKLQKKYKNVWVAISGKKIISYGKSLKEVESKAQDILGKKDVFTMYIESGAAIY